MIRKILVLAIIFLNLPQLATAETILSRTLKLGDRGEDVRLLQQSLNKDPDTQVATSGLGSIGNESTYFGQRTREAVIRFQEKYASSTLAPLGLTEGTGILGKFTLNFMAQLLGLSTSSPVLSHLTLPTLPNVVNVISDATKQFNIPAPIPPSVVSSQVNNPKPTLAVPGVGMDAYGRIVPPGVSLVSLTKISPTEGGPGTLVTITGAGFSTSSPNRVFVGGEEQNVVSSDGFTLTVRVNSPALGGKVDNNMATSVKSVGGSATNAYTGKGYNVNSGQINIIGGQITYTAIKSNGRSVSGTLGNLNLSGLSLPMGIFVVDKKGVASNGLTFKLND